MDHEDSLDVRLMRSHKKRMMPMFNLITGVIALRVAFWVLLVSLVVVFAPEIGGALDSAVDRFDYMIGYEQ